jgi:branched-chain amino acid transport system permease protein
MSENTDTTFAPPPPHKKNTLGGRITAIFENKYIGWPALAIALLMPFITASAYSLNVMTTALIFVVLAAGLNIVVGYCGLLDLGYIAFLAVGAYTAGILSKMFELPVLFTLPAVIVMTVLAGLIIGAPTLRLRSDYLAIVTLGFGEITRITANNLQVTGGPSGIFGIPSFLTIGGVDLQEPVIFYYITVLIVAGLVLAAARLGKSRLGRAWRYVKEDEDAAEAMGIHTYKVKLLAYIFGAIWGGFAGILFASHLSAVSPQSFLFLQSALVLGALVISLLPELLRDFAEYRYLVFGVLLVVVMVFRPQGFWPARGQEPERKMTAVDAAVIEGRSR